MTETAPRRYAEIDLLKGLACALMLMGHAVRIRMGVPLVGDKLLLFLFDWSGPIFFFMSGMNVITFIEHNEPKRNFDARKFYLSAAAVLYFLGYTYNFNRNTMSQLDIFQGIAIGTAVVYLLMRTKLPTWAHFVIAAAIYVVYLRFRTRLELGLIVPNFHRMRTSVGPEADLWALARTGYGAGFARALPPLVRHWFLHFTPFFWTIFVYVGALCHRSVTRDPQRQWRWVAFFAACFVGGPFVARNVFAPGVPLLEGIYFKNAIDLSVRGVPSYVLTTLGAAGLAYLCCRKFYRGAAAMRPGVRRWLAARAELFGKESLMFLVVHWLMIMLTIGALNGVEGLLRARGRDVMVNFYLRGVLALAATMWAVPRLARWRDRLRASPMYVRNVVTAMLVGLTLYICGAVVGNAVVAHFATYFASIGFAFLYPHLRDSLRRRCTTPL